MTPADDPSLAKPKEDTLATVTVNIDELSRTRDRVGDAVPICRAVPLLGTPPAPRPSLNSSLPLTRCTLPCQVVYTLAAFQAAVTDLQRAYLNHTDLLLNSGGAHPAIPSVNLAGINNLIESGAAASAFAPPPPPPPPPGIHVGALPPNAAAAAAAAPPGPYPAASLVTLGGPYGPHHGPVPADPHSFAAHVASATGTTGPQGYDDGERKDKKKKRRNDPNAPKRPLTLYFLFGRMTRDALVEEFDRNEERIVRELDPEGKERKDKVKNKFINDELRNRYHNLSEEEKNVYQRLYERNNTIYEAQKNAYKSGLPVPQEHEIELPPELRDLPPVPQSAVGSSFDLTTPSASAPTSATTPMEPATSDSAAAAAAAASHVATAAAAAAGIGAASDSSDEGNSSSDTETETAQPAKTSSLSSKKRRREHYEEPKASSTTDGAGKETPGSSSKADRKKEKKEKKEKKKKRRSEVEE